MTRNLASVAAVAIVAAALGAGLAYHYRAKPADLSAALEKAEAGLASAEVRIAAEREAANTAAEAARVAAVAEADAKHRETQARLSAEADALRRALASERTRIRAMTAAERETALGARLGAPDVACGDLPGPGDPPRCILGAEAVSRALEVASEGRQAPAREAVAVGMAVDECEHGCAVRLADAARTAAREVAAVTAERDANAAKVAMLEAKIAALEKALAEAPSDWYAAPETWGVVAGALAVGAGVGAIAWEAAR